MLVFLKPEGVFKKIADEYIKNGEVAKVSKPIEFQGESFREIVFNKKFLGKSGRDITGIVFVREDGQKVTDSRLLRELTELAYQIELFFDDAYTKNMSRAIASDKDLLKEERDYKYIKASLELLSQEEVKGTDTVDYILSKLPGLKEENNKLLESLLEKIKSISEKETVFSQNTIDEISNFYKQALLKNLQKVRLINRGRNVYDNIKSEAIKHRKKMRYRALGRSTGEGFGRLEYIIGYFIRVIEIYAEVVNFDEQEYLRYLKNMDKTKVEERLNLIR